MWDRAIKRGHGLKQVTSLILKSTFVLVGRESDRIIVGESMYIQQLLKA